VFDVVDSGFEDNLSEFTIPYPRSDSVTESALYRREDCFGHPALIVVLIIHPAVVSFIEMGELTMLDQRTDSARAEFVS
jgi:hypothetical protein